MADNRVVLMGCGDIGPLQEPMNSYTVLARSTLASADIRFAHCERVYSDRGKLGTGKDHGLLQPHKASIFSDCSIDVASVASNHCMEFGEEAMLDSIANLRTRGVQTIGAGRNLQEAQQPVVIECNGVRVAFLAYCSVLREGYVAGIDKAGAAPMRAHARCEPMEWQPGVPPMVVTTPFKEDLDALIEEIQKAKKTAHIVVLSMHWGIHYVPRIIADYQPVVADAALKAGADLILGHHAHVPKAIGVHSGKICFYSLGGFIFSTENKSPEQAAAFSRRYSVVMDPDYPHLTMGRDAKRSLIAKAVLTREGVTNVSFLPVLIDKQLRPEVLHHGDPRFNQAIEFMEWVSDGHNHRFTVEGDEVAITGN